MTSFTTRRARTSTRRVSTNFRKPDKIGAFLMRPQAIPRIEAAFFMVTDPRLQQLLSDAIYLD
jgi:hypothetical protein